MEKEEQENESWEGRENKGVNEMKGGGGGRNIEGRGREKKGGRKNKGVRGGKGDNEGGK